MLSDWPGNRCASVQQLLWKPTSRCAKKKLVVTARHWAMGGKAEQSASAFDADAVVLNAKLGAPTEVLEQAQTSEP